MANQKTEDNGSRSEKEKMLAGEPYLAYTPELVDERNHELELLKQFNNATL